MKVIDNFLPSYQFKELQSIILNCSKFSERELLDNAFPWYWNEGVCYAGDPFYQLYHILYENDHSSIFLPALDFLLSRIKHKKMYRIKANLNPRTIFHRNTGYHIDMENMTTSILYLNTNNGWTEIKGHGKVKCVENRFVTFDSNLQHAGVTCTRPKRKVVINFNYTI